MDFPPDRLFARPWLDLLTYGVRRGYRWSDPFLRRTRLHHWLAYWNPGDGAGLRVDSVDVPLGPGSLVLVPSGTWLQRHDDRPFDHWWCHLRVAATPVAEGAIVLAAAGQLGGLLARSWRLSWELGPRAAASTASAHAALATALDQVAWREPAVSEDPRIAGLLDALGREGHPHLANRDLAAKVGMHPTAFCRRFHQVVGLPPQDWLRERRLDTAAERLAQGMPVAEAADLGGFTDRFHFSRLFRRHRGIAPGQYRLLCSPGNPGR